MKEFNRSTTVSHDKIAAWIHIENSLVVWLSNIHSKLQSAYTFKCGLLTHEICPHTEKVLIDSLMPKNWFSKAACTADYLQ